MNKEHGYVTFINEDIDNVKEKEVIEKQNIIIYPTIADSLRFASIDDEKVITKVRITDKAEPVSSEYYGYNMLIANKVLIDKIFNYEEVINIMKKENNEEQLQRFIKAFLLNDKDKKYFESKSFKTFKDVRYYQDADKTVYNENLDVAYKKFQKYEHKNK